MTLAALVQGAAIVVAGYFVWMGVPTLLANSVGAGVAGAVLPILNLAALLVPIAAGARAARLAGAGPFAHGFGAGAAGVAILSAGMLVLLPESVSLAGCMGWIAAGAMLAWLGAILEPHMFRNAR